MSADGLYESTLKEYVTASDGSIWLWPRSSDPEHQAPLKLNDKSRKTESVSIIGVVVASLVLESKRTA